MRQIIYLSMPWLREFISTLPWQRTGFNPRPTHIEVLVDKVMGQVFH
jgi:hypothetical protein